MTFGPISISSQTHMRLSLLLLSLLQRSRPRKNRPEERQDTPRPHGHSIHQRHPRNQNLLLRRPIIRLLTQKLNLRDLLQTPNLHRELGHGDFVLIQADEIPVLEIARAGPVHGHGRAGVPGVCGGEVRVLRLPALEGFELYGAVAVRAFGVDGDEGDFAGAEGCLVGVSWAVEGEVPEEVVVVDYGEGLGGGGVCYGGFPGLPAEVAAEAWAVDGCRCCFGHC